MSSSFERTLWSCFKETCESCDLSFSIYRLKRHNFFLGLTSCSVFNGCTFTILGQKQRDVLLQVSSPF